MLVWCAATLGVQPPAGWWAEFAAASGPILHRFEPQSLALSAWGLAKLGVVPDLPQAPQPAASSSRNGDGSSNSSQQQAGRGTQTQSTSGPVPATSSSAVIASSSAADSTIAPTPAGAAASLDSAASRRQRRGEPAAADSPWMQQLWSASRSSLPTFDAQALSNLLWAAATLRQAPPAAWLAAAEAACLQHAHSAGSSVSGAAQQRTNGQSAAAEAPGGGVAADGLVGEPTAGAAGSRQGFSPQQLANVLWALAELRASPSPPMAAALAAAVERLAPHWTPQSLAIVLEAAAALELPLSEQAVERLLAPSQAALVQASPQALASLLAAAARLPHAPPLAWRDAAAAAAMQHLPQCDAAQLSCAGWSLSRLGCRDGSFWHAWRDAVAARSGELNAAQLAQSLQAAVAAPGSPNDAWIERISAAAIERIAAGCEPQSLSLIAWGMARLGHAPDAQQLAALLAAARGASLWAPQLCRSAVQLMWALASMAAVDSGANQAAPPRSSSPSSAARAKRARHAAIASAVLQLAVQCAPWLARAAPGDAAAACWALRKARAQPPPELAAALLDATQAQLSRMAAAELSSTLWSLAGLQMRPPAAWWDAFYAASAPQLPQWGCQSVANAAWALARLQQRPAVPWMAALVHRSLAVMPRCSLQELADIGQGFGATGVSPGRRWVAVFISQAVQRLHGSGGAAGRAPSSSNGFGGSSAGAEPTAAPAGRRHHSASIREVAALLQACAELRAAVPPEALRPLLAACFVATLPLLPAASAADLRRLGDAVVRLKRTRNVLLDREWVAAWAAALQRSFSLRSAKQRHAAVATLALAARLGCRQDTRWLLHCRQRVRARARARRLPPADLMRALSALGLLMKAAGARSKSGTAGKSAQPLRRPPPALLPTVVYRLG